MIVSMKRMQEILEENQEIIENSIPENYQEIGYDLRVKDILVFSEKDDERKQELQKYSIPAGETVFVSTVENICMPLNMIGIVTQRNSLLRSGLRVEAPIYLPGHHTKVFLRVTNISKNEILLNQNDGIASIMFEYIDGEVQGYNGHFVDEFNYKGIGNFDNDIPKVVSIDKKMESLANIEKNLYERVVALLTIFVGIFSLINLNVQFLSEHLSIQRMVVYNLVSLGGIGILVSFVGFVMHDKMNRTISILLSSLVLIGVAIFLLFKLSI